MILSTNVRFFVAVAASSLLFTRAQKSLLGECEFDCDIDSDCAPGLLCADSHKKELIRMNLDKRKAYCENDVPRYLEVCYDPDKLKLGECEPFDCDEDQDCATGLVCADKHKPELILAGQDERKAYCGNNVGEWNYEVCFDPEKIEVCLISKQDPTNFFTINMADDDWPPDNSYDILPGRCEEDINCQSLCFGEQGFDPIVGEENSSECASKCGQGRPVAVEVSGDSPVFSLISCSPNTVEYTGTLTFNQGDYLIYDAAEADTCSPCDHLYRKVVTVKVGSTGKEFVLTTEPMTFEEWFDPDAFDPDIATDFIEPTLECVAAGERRSIASFPNDCDEWKDTNSDGECTYTNCNVGKDGTGADCFSCGSKCDNGCGAADGFFNPPDNFFLWDFGEACCVHDYCYSSTYSKITCDWNFRSQMRDACPQIKIRVRVFFWTVKVRLAVVPGCLTAADAYYAGVSLGGFGARSDAQSNQATHEESDKCQPRLCTDDFSAMTDQELFQYAVDAGEGKVDKIGRHCYIQNATGLGGVCNYYAKGELDYGQPGYDGIPVGTGCIVGDCSYTGTCWYTTSIPGLDGDDIAALCSDDCIQNGAYQIRYGIAKGYCDMSACGDYGE